MSFSEIVIMVSQFLLSLSLLIILHEWGHYFPAKKFKTRVEKFYLFFDAWGKKLFSYKYKGTEYGIGWLLLGGYVKISGMIDESMDKEQMAQEPKPWEFRSKPAWQRLIIMLGGVIVNFVLAYIIFVFVSFIWGDKYLHNDQLKDGIIVTEFAEKELGLKNGDKIISIDGEKPVEYREMGKNILFGNEIVIERNNELINLDIPVDILGRTVDAGLKSQFIGIPLPIVVEKVPDTSLNKGVLKERDILKKINGQKLHSGNFIDVFKTLSGTEANVLLSDVNGKERIERVTVSDTGKLEFISSTLSEEDMEKLGYYTFSVKEYSFGQSFKAGGQKFVGRFNDMIDNVSKLLNSHKTGAAKGLGSFISIAKIFPTEWDWHYFWNLTAFLSIMLGVLNLLPIPALDGGHVMFLLYEMITGRKPSEKFLEYAQIVGFAILMIIFVFAFGNDIYRHFIK